MAWVNLRVGGAFVCKRSCPRLSTAEQNLPVSYGFTAAVISQGKRRGPGSRALVGMRLGVLEVGGHL